MSAEKKFFAPVMPDAYDELALQDENACFRQVHGLVKAKGSAFTTTYINANKDGEFLHAHRATFDGTGSAKSLNFGYDQKPFYDMALIGQKSLETLRQNVKPELFEYITEQVRLATEAALRTASLDQEA